MVKNNRLVVIVSFMFLVLIFGGATYAYLKNHFKDNLEAPIQVTGHTTDSLMFNVNNDISIIADYNNFDEGMGNQEGVAIASAVLKANNKTNTATDNYYLYLYIKENEMAYTTEERTAELVLQVTDPSGRVLGDGDIPGLSYVTVMDGLGEEISGFDITQVIGPINIANNYEIATTSEKTDVWQVKIVYVNLPTDQEVNARKKFNGRVDIQKNEKTLSDECVGSNLSQCIKENYWLDSNIYYHKNLANSAEDNSYRYAGSYDSVNNYVCFGYDGSDACPWDNMYRIIGVFDKNVKLIKADYAKAEELGTNGDYSGIYNSNGKNKGMNSLNEVGAYYLYITSTSNIWKSSKLNTVNLNENYLNSFDESWQNMILMYEWQVGGNLWANIGKQKLVLVYQSEIVNPYVNEKYNAKVGLMYVSDYGFAAEPSAWEFDLNSFGGVSDKNWMHNGIYEWTITQVTGGDVFKIHPDGFLMCDYGYKAPLAVRPCFYLESSVVWKSGSGTKNDPIMIA